VPTKHRALAPAAAHTGKVVRGRIVRLGPGGPA